MLVDDRAVGDVAGRPGSSLHLRPASHRIEFHYTGLSFVAPERVRFRYRLEGFDRDWIEAGPRRAAYYTNLPPGHYRFAVTAANAHGVWNTNIESIGFEVQPHFLQRRWFLALCVTAALALARGLYLLHLRRLRRQFALVLAERTRVAREMHDTLISGRHRRLYRPRSRLGHAAARNVPAIGDLERAREQLRHSLDDARRAMWDLRNPSSPGQDLPTALGKTIDRLAARSSAAIVLEQNGCARPLARAREEGLLRVAQEAITNAVTHAAANRITVRLHFDARSVRLSVTDDGRGFDATARVASNGNQNHFGLVGMRERAEAWGGHLTIESAAGSGTTVTATMPAGLTPLA